MFTGSAGAMLGEGWADGLGLEPEVNFWPVSACCGSSPKAPKRLEVGTGGGDESTGPGNEETSPTWRKVVPGKT